MCEFIEHLCFSFHSVQLSSGYIGGTFMSVVMASSHVLLGANKEGTILGL